MKMTLPDEKEKAMLCSECTHRFDKLPHTRGTGF